VHTTTRGLFALLVATMLVAVGCGDNGDGGGDGDDDERLIRVAILMPGRQNDVSFNQSAAVAIRAVAERDADVEFTILDEIPDPTESEPALRQFATEGYDLIIGHGIEYVEPINTVAAGFPETAFMTAAAAAVGFEPTDNINDWSYDFDSMGYPLGVASALVSSSGHLGIVGGPELDFVKIMHGAYVRGAQSINSDIQVDEVFAGSFDDAQAATEAAQSLIDGGADVLYCSGDGICQGVAQAAQQAGVILVTGFGDLNDAAPGVAMTATVLTLDELYEQFVEMIRAGNWGNEAFLSELSNGQVSVIPLHEVDVDTAAPIADVQGQLDEVVAGIVSGDIDIHG
jgi:basic membrane protein A